ncbi:MAG: sulfite exporter TauE/SafE family protein [Endomicrobium sp.]|jgi:uncharacterized membrane protein YfcA|nr:sulfite exporter TauE/SafE family protein [Endomicrobium sp.]
MGFLIYIIIGTSAGILGGLLGIGGSTILIPFMLIFLKMSQHQAQGTALAVICLSFFSMLVYYKKGYVNLTIAALIGIGFVIGGFLGASVVDAVPEHILKKMFAFVLFFIAVKMFISK